MSDPIRLINFTPKVVASLEDTDLSLVEKAAVLRLAAEACQQAQVLQEIAIAIAKNRGPAR